MMKNIQWVINGLLLAAVAVLFFLVMRKNDGPAETKQTETPKQDTLATKDSDTLSLAEDNVPVDTSTPDRAYPEMVFVNIEAMDREYRFIANSRTQLEKKGAELDKSLQQWRGNLEKKAMEAQQKYEKGEMKQEDMLKVQQELMGDQQELMAYAEEKGNDLMEEKEKLNDRMFSNIEKFLKSYAGKRNIKFVFAYDQQGAGGILYADPNHDVTNEVIKGLNGGK